MPVPSITDATNLIANTKYNQGPMKLWKTLTRAKTSRKKLDASAGCDIFTSSLRDAFGLDFLGFVGVLQTYPATAHRPVTPNVMWKQGLGD
jgi:hypothetical protein